jgi:hypothetical protein
MAREELFRHKWIVLVLVAVSLQELAHAQWDSITEFPAWAAGLTNITAGPDGALWFTGSGAIGRITTMGQVSYFAVAGSSRLGGHGVPHSLVRATYGDRRRRSVVCGSSRLQ